MYMLYSVKKVQIIASVTSIYRLMSRKISPCFQGPLAKYVKLGVAHAPGMPWALSPPPRVFDSGMYHDTCVTHVLWCMPVSLTSGILWSRWRGNVLGIPGACATRICLYLVRGPLWSNIVLNRLFLQDFATSHYYSKCITIKVHGCYSL